jgi:ABC-2 type transport system ATP-binding protein
MITTKGLTKLYDETHGIKGIDLNVRKGTSMGLLGRNGAGKTTLIRTLIGLVRADSGQATVNGLDVITQPDEVRKIIGYLPETYGLYDDMTVYRLLDYTARLYRIEGSLRMERIGVLLEQFELSPSKNIKVGTLSKGNRQKVAFARALLNDPAVIFLDEPTSGLDPVAARSVESLICDLKRDGKTLLITSHILSEAEKMCDDVTLIKDGTVRVSGSIGDVKRKYGKPMVIVRLQGPQSVEQAATLLKPMFKDGFELLDDGISISTATPDIVAPMVNKALVSANIQVLEVKQVEESLGDVYFQVMED